MTEPEAKNSDNATNKPTSACKYCTENNTNCIKPGSYAQTLMPGLSADACIRKQLLFIQLLACFPLFGIFIPNAVLVFTDEHYFIPTAHWIMCIGLLVIIVVSFVVKLCYPLPGSFRRMRV